MTATEVQQECSAPGELCTPFEDGEFLSRRKIRPGDLSCFSGKNCPLRQNRFLLYGYYNFGHLLICTKENGEQILGVPGVYDQQERFMANMFGFPFLKKAGRFKFRTDREGTGTGQSIPRISTKGMEFKRMERKYINSSWE